MKTIRIIGIAHALLMSVCFSACSSDDENGYGPDSRDKLLVKIGSQYSISYDELGRVTKSKHDTFTYGDNSITEYGSDGKMICTYQVENGRIVSQTNNNGKTYDFVYDNDGYLVDCGTCSFKWSDGNLVELYYSGDKKVREITYTDIPWPKHFFMYEYNPNIPDIIPFAGMGYLGKSPKNLPSEIFVKPAVSSYYYYFDWEIKNGYPVRVDIYLDQNRSGGWHEYTWQ